MDNPLTINNLCTRFHIPEGIVYAVNGISFFLQESETLAIVGESGCGKSVTMLSILGLIPTPPGEIVSGQALYRGEDLFKKSEREMEQIRGKEIAMIFQDPMTSLNPVLTIGRQITESLCTHLAMDKQSAEKRAIELLEEVGISDPAQRLKEYPHQFSGGMRQRVMIAMALSCRPSVLIADEPTTALDVTIQAQIVELVARLRSQLHMAIIWITHDLGVVACLADRVAVMYAGFIVEEAWVDDLYEHPQHPYTISLLGALPRADRRRDHRLKSIHGAPPSLLVEPRGCPFAPRCEFTLERCWQENPCLGETGERGRETGDRGRESSRLHRVSCWVDPQTGGAR